jgi:formate dehydrogenase-N alpha subunit
MTNHWVDIKNANVVVVMGGNAAEAHPVGFRWAMEAKNNNDALLIVVDPRFTRTASVADIYAPIRSGTDIAFLSGVLLYLIENDKINDFNTIAQRGDFTVHTDTTCLNNGFDFTA